MLHQIKAPQFYAELGLQKNQMVKFKNFSRPLRVFQVLFKANFIFKDFSRQSCIFKYFSSLCEPWMEAQTCTRIQSHQYFHWSDTKSSNVRQKRTSLGPLGCCNGDSDKPAHMYSLINTFTGHTQKVATSDKSLYLTIH